MLKKSKEQLLSEIHGEVNSVVCNAISWKLSEGNQVTINDLRYIICDAVATGVEAGIKKLLDSRYTDDDFEHDLTLKP